MDLRALLRVMGLAAVVGSAVVAIGDRASGQSSSMFGAPGARQALSLQQNSPFFNLPEPPREIQLRDIITVIVDEKSQFISEGEVDRRKNANINAALQDWIKLDGFGITPAPQTNGDPRVRGQINSQYRAEAEVETRDALKFRVAATVVDVRPNGLLVLEAHREVGNNEERWEYSLSGVVRREDVLPNNTVLSEDIAELRVDKREAGHVRDGYRRGWFLRWLDTVAPF
jgi:flagellar L-ring protein FlgH